MTLPGINLLREVANSQVAPARDHAAGRVFQPGQQLEQCRFAPTIFADEADAFAFYDLQVNFPENGVAAIIFAYFREICQQHYRCPPWSDAALYGLDRDGQNLATDAKQNREWWDDRIRK